MFVFIVIFLLFLGSIPLIRTIRRRERLDEEERRRRYRRSVFVAGTAVTFAIVYFNLRRHFSVTLPEKAGIAAFLVAFPLSLISGIWIQGGWEQVLFFVNRSRRPDIRLTAITPR